MENSTTVNQGTGKLDRVYSLDALRGIMMLLGLVIHAGITYGSIDYGYAWSLKDPNNNTIVFDIIVSYIHAFRMPVFFVTAGYFGALLFYKKGAGSMIINRTKRIILPFLLSVLIVWPLIVFAFVFSGAAFSGTADPFNFAWSGLMSGNFLPFNVGHLWFLYFLAIYSIVGWIFGSVFSKVPGLNNSLGKMYQIIISIFWLRIFCMIIVFFCCLSWMGTAYLQTNNNWSVDPAIFTTYFVFFATGWFIYRAGSLKYLSGYPWWQLCIASFLFLFSTFFSWPPEVPVVLLKQILAAIYTPLFIFGFIALFLTYFSNYSASLSYLMEASYWVYIIHLPIVAFIPGLLAGTDFPPFFKFAIVISVTSTICFASYKYFVRGSLIGKFLNGKIYKRKRAMGEKEIMAVQ